MQSPATPLRARLQKITHEPEVPHPARLAPAPSHSRGRGGGLCGARVAAGAHGGVAALYCGTHRRRRNWIIAAAGDRHKRDRDGNRRQCSTNGHHAIPHRWSGEQEKRGGEQSMLTTPRINRPVVLGSLRRSHERVTHRFQPCDHGRHWKPRFTARPVR